ncbi:HD domain-containing protein [Brucepastera parasyntrophica]|uniref:HD-GYP domain-containing protein n=1 Tax=Brucepastera parasyntrophica TaxID=2880008 RepID=UPI00210B0836|nr:HD domain-containing phosphohydrolase [Brucepastera parasyntrophica]ULQ59285.1 HD domain-containing protein [Brucepastera parasyntrophica]
MVFRIFSLIFILVGAVIMVLTTIRYHRFIRATKETTYRYKKSNYKLQILAEIIMIVFIFGFAVGAADIFLREVEPIYVFVTFIFFLGAGYISFMVNNEIMLAESMQAKTLEVTHAFVNSIEIKDQYTQGHSRHVYHIVKNFYEALPLSLRRKINAPKLFDAALLHDIGKIGIADEILNKKGKLDDTEWEIMKTHPKMGRKMLNETCFQEIGEWVLYHHERIDGNGYYGLRGEDIPVESKIIAIADTFSALSTDRNYRPKTDYSHAIEIIRSVAGSQLDAGLVDIFCTVPEENLIFPAAYLPREE